jgi:type IV secretion system protein VirB6
MGLLCVYAMFLIALSSVASSVLLALGPLFVALLLFDATRRFFEAWIAQLATYALISVLTVLVSSLMLHIVDAYARQTAALGSSLHTVDALDTILLATIAFLLLRQVMPIAAALAGGLALNTFGTVSRSLSSMLRGAGRSSRDGGTIVVKKLLVREIHVTPPSARQDRATATSWRNQGGAE